MRTLSPFFLSVVCLVLPVSAEPSQSGGTWFFSVPTKEVEKVRSMAREPKKGTSARLVYDTLGEKPGVKRIFYHWNWPEWLDKPMQRRGYGFGKDGGTRNDESNVLRYQLKVENGVALQSLALECGDEVNASGTESISFSADCGFLPVYEGQWREMGAWEQGETTWLMWDRFPEAERRDDPAPNGKMWFIEPPPGTSEDADVRREAQFQADAVLACTVELLFFKTTPVAVGQMAKAGPGNREKAAQWLMARDQPWRKLRICQRADGEKRKWSMIHDKRSASKADGVVYKSGLNLQIGGKRTDEVLSMDVVLNHQEGVPTSEWFTATLALEKVTPAWNFALVEKCGELNVVVYRELKPEW